ncbi:hypothetical protein NliqN6_5149 [Naganishia liquefaciens]|uniref:Uncharacterized protein n=1 Tax=Naganishia liquefaciens TaxID=104408 RepID=A0A8H3TX43_9TREE|nr:hypothetical protein NliqN6_5149 [Naganishia liquefaciens]
MTHSSNPGTIQTSSQAAAPSHEDTEGPDDREDEDDDARTGSKKQRPSRQRFPASIPKAQHRDCLEKKIAQVAIEFRTIKAKQERLGRSASPEVAERLRSVPQENIDVKKVLQEVIQNLSVDIQALRARCPDLAQESVAERSVEILARDVTLQVLVDIIVKAIEKASYDENALQGTKAFIGFGWATFRLHRAREQDEISEQVFQKMARLVPTVILLSTTITPGLAQLCLEAKIHQLCTANADHMTESNRTCNIRHWRAFHADLVGISIVCALRAIKQIHNIPVVLHNVQGHPRWYLHKLALQHGLCGAPGCNRALLFDPLQRKSNSDGHWARFASIRTVVSRGNIDLDDGQSPFPSFPCLVAGFTAEYHPKIASMFWRYCSVFHADERKLFGKQLITAALVMPEDFEGNAHPEFGGQDDDNPIDYATDPRLYDGDNEEGEDEDGY